MAISTGLAGVMTQRAARDEVLGPRSQFRRCWGYWPARRLRNVHADTRKDRSGFRVGPWAYIGTFRYANATSESDSRRCRWTASVQRVLELLLAHLRAP